MALSEDQVKNAVVIELAKMNYRPTQIRTLSEHGCDIIARHVNYGRYFQVEVKGDAGRSVKNSGSGREVRFIYALGQIITRIHPERGYRYGLAFPMTYRKLVTGRLHYSVLKVLHLELFFADSHLHVEHLTWKDMKQITNTTVSA